MVLTIILILILISLVQRRTVPRFSCKVRQLGEMGEAVQLFDST